MLHGNYSVINKLPLTYRAGISQSGERSNWGGNGQKRSVQLQDRQTTANELYALPQGGYAGLAWMLPQQAGNLASINAAGLVLTPAGTAVGGITSDASADLAITVANAEGQLITSGSGSATLALNVSPALLTASLNAAGSASLLFDAAALLGAKASGTGAATFAVTGAVTPYAIGQMAGSTVDAGVLTPASIAGAVWTSDAAQYADAGTMGELLNSAGAAADPLLGTVEGTLTLRDVMRLMLAVNAGDATGLEGSSMVFKSQDGATNRVQASYSSGARTITLVDPA
jgi:hypothetical protein